MRHILNLPANIPISNVDFVCGRLRMLRFVVIAVGLVVLCLMLMKLAAEIKKANIDWIGIAFACGFIVLAFYLRNATGMG
jgi:hypothetical protein